MATRFLKGLNIKVCVQLRVSVIRCDLFTGSLELDKPSTIGNINKAESKYIKLNIKHIYISRRDLD